MWRFGELRRRAIEEWVKLERNPAEIIMLGRDYRVESCLVSGDKELVECDSGLTMKEKERLGSLHQRPSRSTRPARELSGQERPPATMVSMAVVT